MIDGSPRILIIRLSAIGDVVRVLPALHSLRQKYPNAQIDWAVEPKSAPIVEGHPCLDRILVFDRPAGRIAAIAAFRRFRRQVREGRYDIAIDFHGILKSGLIASASRARERYGFSRPRSQEMSGLFTNHKVRLRSRYLNRTEENLLLCDSLCQRRDLRDETIYVPQDVQDDIDAYFEKTFDASKLVVAMHAPVDRKEKQWPLDNFGQLADLLLADGRFEVLLTWGPGQAGVAEDVRKRTLRNPIICPETVDLKHLIRILHRADLYVGGDTGPMHIAAAMGTSVVAIFGGTDPAKHAPYRRPCQTLYVEDHTLSPEEKLRRITPQMAYEACVRVSSRR